MIIDLMARRKTRAVSAVVQQIEDVLVAALRLEAGTEAKAVALREVGLVISSSLVLLAEDASGMHPSFALLLVKNVVANTASVLDNFARKMLESAEPEHLARGAALSLAAVELHRCGIALSDLYRHRQ